MTTEKLVFGSDELSSDLDDTDEIFNHGVESYLHERELYEIWD